MRFVSWPMTFEKIKQLNTGRACMATLQTRKRENLSNTSLKASSLDTTTVKGAHKEKRDDESFFHKDDAVTKTMNIGKVRL